MTVECILPLTPETTTALTDHNDEAECYQLFISQYKNLITKFQLL